MMDLVSVSWLKSQLNNKDLVLLDASLQTTVSGSTSDYGNSTIEGARYFDLKNNFSDTDSPFPNTIPSEGQFEDECRKLGINQSSKIVVFDKKGIYSSPRVWWMFKVMGHEAVSVLNGGLPEWIKAGLPVVDRKGDEFEEGDFKASYQKEYVKSYEDVLSNLTNKTFNIVDARSRGRFDGTEEDPRKHLKSGHIPDSINLPFSELLEDGKFKSEEELESIFKERYANANDLVFSCGSGLTACIVSLASEIAHQPSRYIYDGSWTEWAELQGLVKDGNS